MVIYVDPKHILALEEIKIAVDNTKVLLIPLSLEDTGYYQELGMIHMCRILNPLLNAGVVDTPLYALVNWTKFYLLNKTIENNPFSSDYFSWLDIGITHVADIQYIYTDNVFTDIPDKIRLMILRPFTQADINNRRGYCSAIRGLCAAGYITGHIDSMKKLCKLFDQEIYTSLSMQLAPSEEQILPIIMINNPELFDVYYGDYDHILTNYRHQRGSFSNIIMQLQYCRMHSYHQIAYTMGEKLISAHKQGLMSCTAYQLSQILDECYIGAYYYKNESALSIAQYYVDQLFIDPEFILAFRHREGHIRNNFVHISPTLFDKFDRFREAIVKPL